MSSTKLEIAKNYINDNITQASLDIFKLDSGTEPDKNYIVGQYHACLLCREIIDINNLGDHMKILKDNFGTLNSFNLNMTSAYFDGFIFTITMIENILDCD